MSAILEVVKSPYFNEKSYDFDKIWYATSHLELEACQMTKYEHIKI